MEPRLRRPSARLGLAAAGVLSFLAGAALADEEIPLRSGATSVQLLALGGSSRSSLRAAGLYIKRHLSRGSALRAGVDFSLDESTGSSPPGYATPYSANSRSYGVTVSGEYDRYLASTGQVAVFVGIGPYWTRGRNLYEYSETRVLAPGELYGYNDRREIRTWELGGTAVVGFEWFFRPRLSVLGRVGAGLGFGERHESEDTREFGLYNSARGSRLNSTTVSAGTSTAALGLSAYF
jgi:hypothetical protein